MKVEVTGIEAAKEAVAKTEAAMADKPALHARIAKGARPVVSNWLQDRDAKASHRAGWPRSGYWAHASEAAIGESDETAAWVAVRKEGIGLHLRGGTVKSSRPGGKLAIPLRAELAGVNPREKWPDRKGAFVLASKGRGPSGRAFLAYKEGGALRLAYLLLSSVTLDADPSVIPPGDRLAEAARKACLSYMRKAAKSVSGAAIRTGPKGGTK